MVFRLTLGHLDVLLIVVKVVLRADRNELVLLVQEVELVEAGLGRLREACLGGRDKQLVTRWCGDSLGLSAKRNFDLTVRDHFLISEILTKVS